MNELRDQIADKLRHLAPEHETGRIWGRLADASADTAIAGNAWAASPEDVADEIMTVFTPTPSADHGAMAAEALEIEQEASTGIQKVRIAPAVLVSYDPSADAVYLDLRPKGSDPMKVAEVVGVPEEKVIDGQQRILIDLDINGEVIGVEILGASKEAR